MPLDEEKDVLCPVFGRTPYFGVYDIETGEKKVEENPAAQAQGGAGLQAAQFVLDCEADVLITARCGKIQQKCFRQEKFRFIRQRARMCSRILRPGKKENLPYWSIFMEDMRVYNENCSAKRKRWSR